MKEETGLRIASPRICGMKDWVEDGIRYVVLFYKTEKFEGDLISSEEGEVWWEDLKELPNLDLSLDMEDMLRIFLEEDLSEFFLLPRWRRLEVRFKVNLDTDSFNN